MTRSSATPSVSRPRRSPRRGRQALNLALSAAGHVRRRCSWAASRSVSSPVRGASPRCSAARWSRTCRRARWSSPSRSAVHDLHVGDVMLFNAPIDGHPPVVHRIHEIIEVEGEPGVPDQGRRERRARRVDDPPPLTHGVAGRARHSVRGNVVGLLHEADLRVTVLVLGVGLMTIDRARRDLARRADAAPATTNATSPTRRPRRTARPGRHRSRPPRRRRIATTAGHTGDVHRDRPRRRARRRRPRAVHRRPHQAGADVRVGQPERTDGPALQLDERHRAQPRVDRQLADVHDRLHREAGQRDRRPVLDDRRLDDGRDVDSHRRRAPGTTHPALLRRARDPRQLVERATRPRSSSNACIASINLVAGTTAGFGGDTGQATRGQAQRARRRRGRQQRQRLHRRHDEQPHPQGHREHRHHHDDRRRRHRQHRLHVHGHRDDASRSTRPAASPSTPAATSTSPTRATTASARWPGRPSARSRAAAPATPSCTFSGTATTVTLTAPRGVAVNSSGNVYIADTGNNCVRKVVGTDDQPGRGRRHRQHRRARSRAPRRP